MVAATEEIEASMAPVNEASVTTGTQISFSATGRVPLTFSVASSPSLLAMPDIATGPGIAQSSGSPAVYTFSSPAVSSLPRMVYWTVSFSTEALPECTGAPSKVVTASERTLMVVPATSEVKAKPAPLRLDIKAAKTFHLVHGSITYSVACTGVCVGSSGYRLYIRRPGGRLVYLPKLGLKPTGFSIKGATGGSHVLVRHYKGASMRLLQRLLHKNALLELQIAARAANGSSEAVEANKAALIAREL